MRLVAERVRLSAQLVRFWQEHRFATIEYMGRWYVFDRATERRVSPYFSGADQARGFAVQYQRRVDEQRAGGPKPVVVDPVEVNRRFTEGLRG